MPYVEREALYRNSSLMEYSRENAVRVGSITSGYFPRSVCLSISALNRIKKCGGGLSTYLDQTLTVMDRERCWAFYRCQSIDITMSNVVAIRIGFFWKMILHARYSQRYLPRPSPDARPYEPWHAPGERIHLTLLRATRPATSCVGEDDMILSPI